MLLISYTSTTTTYKYRPTMCGSTMADSMKDVSHTPPEGEDLTHVWERGPDVDDE